MALHSAAHPKLDAGRPAAYCDLEMDAREYRLAAVLVTDIVGFSRMMQQNEEQTIELLQHYAGVVQRIVEAHNGRLVRAVGDTCLCELPNSVHAVKAGVEIQTAIGEHNLSNPRQRFSLRVGLHVGDIYFVEGDAFGEGVTIAGRVQQSAHPGRVALSQDVQSLISGKIDLSVEPMGSIRVRGLERTVALHEITVSKDAEYIPDGWTQDQPELQPIEPSTASGEQARPAGDVTFDQIKPLVLDLIKRSGRRLSVNEARARLDRRGPAVDAALEKLVNKGFLTRQPQASVESEERRQEPRDTWGDWERWDKWDEHRWHHDDKRAAQEDSRWEGALSDPGPAPGAYDPVVEDYKDYAAHAAEKEKAHFTGHLLSYLGVNGGLIALWLILSGFGGFPWWIIVMLGWGIGIVSHYTGVRQKVRETEELDGAEGLTREQLRIYRKLSKARGAWWGHLFSNIATSGLLLGINLITSPGFMWSLFPIGFMAIGVLSHLPAFKSKEHRLLARLKQLGARIGGRFRRKGPRHIEEAAPVTQLAGAGGEAENVRRRLVKVIESMPKHSPLGEDFLPVLDNYVEQIKLLDQKTREIDQIVDGIPVAELDSDLARLQAERPSAGSDAVRIEYDKSIAQIEKQQTSYAELRNEREILRLRLNSGLNQLRQMEIDVARMRNLSSDEEVASIRMLREKAGELNTYLSDLRNGYRELDSLK